MCDNDHKFLHSYLPLLPGKKSVEDAIFSTITKTSGICTTGSLNFYNPKLLEINLVYG